METSSSSPSSAHSPSVPWSEDAPNHSSIASCGSDIPVSTPGERTAVARKRHLASRSSLANPFRSPLKRQKTQSSMSSDASPPSSAQPSPDKDRIEAASSTPASIRKQRQALEARLLLLQQANKCLRENALSTLPQDIARWREAGQEAARDLWKMSGAEAGDWSAQSGVPSRGDYGLESPCSPLPAESNPHKRKATDSPGSSRPPLLRRRSRIISPGAEEEAAALRSADDPVRHPEGEDSQGALSETSLPEVSEMLRRSQSIVGVSSTPRPRKSLLGQDQARSLSSPATAGKMGPERKWNIGTMLDMLGADQRALAWEVEEEDFRDPATTS